MSATNTDVLLHVLPDISVVLHVPIRSEGGAQVIPRTKQRKHKLRLNFPFFR